jgi:hypothetical protein
MLLVSPNDFATEHNSATCKDLRHESLFNVEASQNPKIA